MSTSALVLAQMAGQTATEQARFFFGTELGNLLTTVLGSVGLLFILWSLVKAFKNLLGGAVGPAIRNVITAVFVSAFLFSPAQFGRLVDVATRAIEALLNTFGGLVGV